MGGRSKRPPGGARQRSRARNPLHEQSEKTFARKPQRNRTLHPHACAHGVSGAQRLPQYGGPRCARSQNRPEIAAPSHVTPRSANRPSPPAVGPLHQSRPAPPVPNVFFQPTRPNHQASPHTMRHNATLCDSLPLKQAAQSERSPSAAHLPACARLYRVDQNLKIASIPNVN